MSSEICCHLRATSPTTSLNSSDEFWLRSEEFAIKTSVSVLDDPDTFEPLVRELLSSGSYVLVLFKCAT